jgi:hypothetical protein
MDLNPRRFAVIAVHMQNDIVTAKGAYGGFFAAQAASRDVIGITGKLLDATRVYCTRGSRGSPAIRTWS